MNAAKTEASKDKTSEPRKAPNPEALRAQEQKVTHDKVSLLHCLNQIKAHYR